MTIRQRMQDGLANAMSGLGMAKDKATHTHYDFSFISDWELTNAYRNSWLARKIVDIPAEDATRKWREWQADANQADKIEQVEKRIDLQNKVRHAFQRARLYGVGYIYIGTNRQPQKPLNPESETLRHLTVMSRDDIYIDEYERDTTSENFGLPKMYRSAYSTTQIHPSRVVKFVERESMGMNDLDRDGGDSVLMAAWTAIKNADSTAENVASLVFESKVDVFKVPGLMERCGDDGFVSNLMERFSIANMGKSNHNALVLDSEEEYEQKNQSFGSLNEILMSQYQLAAGAAHIPMTRLVGQSASGLNATGDNEIREYYDEIQSTQNLKIAPALYLLDELIINNALGGRPDNIWYEWKSLWQLSEAQQAEIAEKNANTIRSLVDAGILPDEALQEAAVEIMESTGAMPGLKSCVDRFYGDD